MTDKSDQEKVEAAAEEYAPFKSNPAVNICAANEGFKAGIAWRDRNPAPHVLALVEAVKHYRDIHHMGEPGKIAMSQMFNTLEERLTDLIESRVAMLESHIKFIGGDDLINS